MVTSTIMRVSDLHFNTTLNSLRQPHCTTIYLTFPRRTSHGAATVTVKDIKLGRKTSTIHVSLVQGKDREEVVGYITHSNIAIESGLSLETDWALSPLPYAVNLALLGQDRDPYWKLQSDMPFASFRKASNHLDFFLPRNGQFGNSLADEWIRFSNGERFTTSSLGFVADMWPQLVEAYRESDPKVAKGKFWYPTLLLNLEIKKPLPSEGLEWLFVRVRAKQIKNGRMDLEVVVLDEASDIMAISNHVSFIMDAARNTAKRQGKEKL